MITKIWETISKYAEGVSGKLGVSFKNLQTGESCALFGDEIFPAASVFKIFLLAELFRQVHTGEITLGERRLLEKKYKAEGSGVLKHFDCGANLSIKDYATLMMILSDNTATDLLFELVGSDSIKHYVIDQLGLVATKCDINCEQLLAICFDLEPGDDLLQRLKYNPTWMLNAPAYTGESQLNDETSPDDASRMLEILYRGDWINQEVDGEILGIMKKCQTNNRIPRYLPLAVEVAHKTGTMDRVANDVGIVYTSAGDYILSVFYNGNVASEKEYRENELNLVGEELIANLSKEIYEIFVSY